MRSPALRVSGPCVAVTKIFISPWQSVSTTVGVTFRPCKGLDTQPMMRKNVFWGGGPNSPVSMTTVPSSGVIILLVQEHRSSPVFPAVALHNLPWGLGGCLQLSSGETGPSGVPFGRFPGLQGVAADVSLRSAISCPMAASLA